MARPFHVLLYYLYRRIDDPEAFAGAHRAFSASLGLRGRILIGREGLNGTVSGTREAAGRYMDALRADPVTAGISFKVDDADAHVFPRLSVRCRREIVTLGLGEDDVDPTVLTGRRLSPAAWKEAMRDEQAILLDGRNRAESDLGHFRGAVCPDIETFREFPEWLRRNRHRLEGRRILTYCTGGIRCEKLSGYLRREGFGDVCQLDGGIIAYGQDPATRGEGFDGLCYVFDERIAVEVNHTETRSLVSRCERCGQPSARYRNCSWPPCNRQHFLCEACERVSGRACSESCAARSRPDGDG
jgi:UPF0176 protein